VIENVTGSISDKSVHSAFRTDGGDSPIVADPILDVSGVHRVAAEKAAALVAMKDF
jgi:hypothetical protein